MQAYADGTLPEAVERTHRESKVQSTIKGMKR